MIGPVFYVLRPAGIQEKSPRSSALEREKYAETAHQRNVVHDLVDAEAHALLRPHVVARVETQREPLEQVEFETEPAGAGDPQAARLMRRACAERQVEIEATDPPAQPADLAVCQ